MIKIKNLKVNVEGKRILRGVDMTVDAGEVVAIMGKNGSGKSTLANTIAGHPQYQAEGEIKIDGKSVMELSPDKRANLGLFLASQYPAAVPGLTVNSFLWQLYKKRNKEEIATSLKAPRNDDRGMSVVEFRKWVEGQAKALDLNPELLNRGLNDGFSGGEKKKVEMLQMLVFNPKYLILDEIDSGLDVDALRKIAKTVARVAKEKKIGVLAITHYNRILKYLVPDRVLVVEEGKIVKEGGKELAETIENEGYENEEN
jgi:Fe-S cluster assembly ATP-binding protein